MLDLPGNYEAYDNLASKGIHKNYVDLKSKFPIKSDKLYNRMQRISSCLAHYCAVFGEFDVTPGLIFPFVKLIGKEEAFCFEVILSFLV